MGSISIQNKYFESCLFISVWTLSNYISYLPGSHKLYQKIVWKRSLHGDKTAHIFIINRFNFTVTSCKLRCTLSIPHTYLNYKGQPTRYATALAWHCTTSMFRQSHYNKPLYLSRGWRRAALGSSKE